jgi:predicted Zn-dependent protease with MMP-like domain
MPIAMATDDFDRLVDQALSTIPERLADLIDNVVIMVEDLAPAQDSGLLGYYDGVPLTERDTAYAGVLPDRIVIFREPILDICNSPEDVVEQVRITVVHEIAHHFGIDDDHLDDLGYA